MFFVHGVFSGCVFIPRLSRPSSAFRLVIFVYVIFTYLTGSLSCTYPLLTRCWLSFILFCLMLPCDGHTINYILRGVALFHLICYWRHIFFIYGVGLVQFVQNGSGLVCFLGF